MSSSTFPVPSVHALGGRVLVAALSAALATVAVLTGACGGNGGAPPAASLPPATQLGLLTQPGGGTSGTVLPTQPRVEVRDAAGAVMLGATNPVTATLDGSGGTLGGTPTVSAINGVATFTDLKITGAGTYTLTFSATALTPATSGAIKIDRIAECGRQQSGPNLSGWEMVLGDGNFSPPGVPQVEIADIDTVHFVDRSELRANVQARPIAAHIITLCRVIGEDMLRVLHTAYYQFRLPHLPDPLSASLNGQTVEGHLAVWDGRPGIRVDAIVAWQWLVNPALAEIGQIRIWAGPDPGHWQKVGLLVPDTAWHTIRLQLDGRQGRASVVFDAATYDHTLTMMTRPPSWGTEVAARFAAEAISIFPGPSGGGYHRVEIRDWRWSRQ